MTALSALLGFTAWTVALVFAVLLYRVGVVFARRQPANSWTRGAVNPSDPGLVARIQHAHLNCLESLPVFAAVVLAAHALGKAPVVDAVAAWVLYARLAQSGIHLIGTGAALVFVRANFFAVQLLLFAYMIWGLLA